MTRCSSLRGVGSPHGVALCLRRHGRHTFGRRFRAAGVSFEDRQDLLGHKSGRITTHYSAAEKACWSTRGRKADGQPCAHHQLDQKLKRELFDIAVDDLADGRLRHSERTRRRGLTPALTLDVLLEQNGELTANVQRGSPPE